MRPKASEKTEDRRIAKTRAALSQALFAQLQTKDWNDITIQGLCDDANVARSSFYAHFDTVNDLLASLMSNLSLLLGDLPARSDGWATIEWLVDHISQNKKLFSRIINTPSAAIVFTNVENQTRAALLREFKLANHTPSEIQLAFIMGGVFESLETWARTWKMQQIPTLKDGINRSIEAILKNAS